MLGPFPKPPYGTVLTNHSSGITIRHRMEKARLGREDWLRAARLALLHGGSSAVRVEKLARDLNITKGSFYWHFKNREELLEALLREWEEETTLLIDALHKEDLGAALALIFDEVKRRIVLSERGEWPSDAAIFAWASHSPKVAKRVNKEEQRRIDLLAQLTGQPDRAEFLYLAYIGFLLRRRRVPEAAKRFSILVKIAPDLLQPSKPAQKIRVKKLKRNYEKTNLRSAIR